MEGFKSVCGRGIGDIGCDSEALSACSLPEMPIL